MDVFDFLKNCFYFIFSTIEWHKVTRTKLFCATSINKSITNGQRGKCCCYASKRILLTLRNILVCESLLFLDEKARYQLKFNFIIFEQLSC